jgi:hypothetical protein
VSSPCPSESSTSLCTLPPFTGLGVAADSLDVANGPIPTKSTTVVPSLPKIITVLFAAMVDPVE